MSVAEDFILSCLLVWFLVSVVAFPSSCLACEVFFPVRLLRCVIPFYVRLVLLSEGQ